MNRSLKKTALLILLAASPSLALAADGYRVTDERLKAALEDVPCVGLDPVSGTALKLSEADGRFKVSDATGLQFSAATVSEAADGYLRLKSGCVIREIRIEGLKRITSDAVMYRLKSSKGDIVHLNRLKQDVESIYAMGYFEKVSSEMVGDALVFKVEEHPVVIKTEFSGNKEIKEDKLSEALGIKRYEILNLKGLKAGVDRIKALYREKGYYEVAVKTEREETEGGIILKLSIDENKKLHVKKVSFDGNQHVKTKLLRKLIETKNRWPLGLMKHTGAYMDSSIDMDLLRLEQYYGDQGYLEAKVGRPVIDIREGKGIWITIPISEGPLFHVASIEVSGEMLEDVTKETIMKGIALKPGDVMSRSRLQRVIEGIRDLYMDRGYAFAQVRPETKFDGTEVALNFVISKGEPVHVNRITIGGNTKTREKVIRRELLVNETDLFSSTALKASKDKLTRLGYFKSATIEPVPGPDGKLDLKVDVEEQPTGAFTLGLSYSSEDKFMTSLSLSESNLWGKGYKVKATIDYGKSDKTYMLDIEDPWFMDTPLAVGAQLFTKEDEKLYYTKESHGGNVRFSYPLIERWRHFIAYSYEKVEPLKDIDANYLYQLSYDDLQGGVTSMITNTLYRDTTNDAYRPTHGSDLAVSVEYAGLGGDYHFTRTNLKAAFFFPLYKDQLALMLKGRFGVVNGGNGEDVPDAELFEMGGMNTVRGFEYGDIGPRDSYGNVLGGRAMSCFNVELTYPIPGVPGLSTAIFYDAGNSYRTPQDIDLTNLKQSVGFGFRWITPMGPLRLEYGRVINPKPNESDGCWDFNIGAFF